MKKLYGTERTLRVKQLKKEYNHYKRILTTMRCDEEEKKWFKERINACAEELEYYGHYVQKV